MAISCTHTHTDSDGNTEEFSCVLYTDTDGQLAIDVHSRAPCIH